MVGSGEESGEGARSRTTILSAVPLSRLRMRPSFIQLPDPRAFRQYFRTLGHPSFPSGEESQEEARHRAPSRLDRARLVLQQLQTLTN